MTLSIDLNLRIRKSGLAEFMFNPKRHSLQTLNRLPHLDGPQFADWITFT